MKRGALLLIALAVFGFAKEYINPYWFQDGEKATFKKEYIKIEKFNPYWFEKEISKKTQKTEQKQG